MKTFDKVINILLRIACAIAIITWSSILIGVLQGKQLPQASAILTVTFTILLLLTWFLDSFRK